MMYGWDYRSSGAGWAIVMLMGMFVFGVLLVVGLIALVRRPRAGTPTTPGPTSTGAVDILRERFARGELTEEEYAHRLEILKNPS